MKQILLVTDGCSNVGSSPVMAAAYAQQEGITVNVIGILDYGTIGELGSKEIEEIARAGGGMSRITGTNGLASTMQMLTRKTVVQTIQQAVNKQLQNILGDTTIEDLSPPKRAQVVEVMDELSETTPLQVVLLIDASASMKPKIPAIEQSIRDLMLSLSAREGKSQLAVFHFPGAFGEEEAVLDVNWTEELSGISSVFGRIKMRGATPTGPAILKVIDFIQCDTLKYNNQIGRGMDREREGMLGDYVL